MSIRFDKAKAEAKAKIAGLGASRDKFEVFVAKTLLDEYARDFITLLRSNIKSRQIVNSGQLESNIKLKVDNGGKHLTITMLDYFDYPNAGVRGRDDESNAPDSPYKYRKYGMSKKGRDSIKQMILSGKAKIRDTSKTKTAIGLEKKRKSIVDMQTDRLVYLIKKYGIKRTSYFDDAFNTVFFAFQEDMTKALGEDVIIDIKTISKKK